MAIFGSFSQEKIISLAKLNEDNEQYAHSICYYDVNEQNIFSIQRNFGPLDYSNVDIPVQHYCIIHIQDQFEEFITPSEYNNIHYMWMDGSLDIEIIQRLQVLYNENKSWDSYLMLRFLIDHISPKGMKGSFGCILYDTLGLYLFRNEHIPLNIDFNGNISTIKFTGSYPLDANKLYVFNPGKAVQTNVVDDWSEE